MYTDTKRSAKESEIKPGDVVLLQQQKQNKLSATYENVPYEVIQKDGNSVLVKSPEGVHAGIVLKYGNMFEGNLKKFLSLTLVTKKTGQYLLNMGAVINPS